jgi:hypothetical protein
MLEKECMIEEMREQDLKLMMEKVREKEASLTLRIVDTRIEAAQILQRAQRID